MRRKTNPTRAIDTHVGRRLRMLRASRGLTQENLAERIGISYQQLHKYETGANSVSASRLYELSKLLGVSPDTFFDGIEADEAAAPEACRDLRQTMSQQVTRRLEPAVPDGGGLAAKAAGYLDACATRSAWCFTPTARAMQ